MKHNRYLIGIIFLWLCVFTTSEVQGQSFIESIQVKPIPGLSDRLFQTSDIAYSKGWLFTYDQATEYRIQVYNPETGKKEYEFGRSGRGPGEYLSINIQRGPGPGLLEVSDAKNKKNDIYDVSCLQQKPPVSETHDCIIKTIANATTRQALILQGNLVLNHGSTIDGVLFLSRGSQKLNYIDKIPQEVKDKYNRPIHVAMSMTGKLTANKNRTRFAYFADSFDRALFYKRNGGQVELMKEHEYSWLPNFEVKDFGASSMLIPAENYRAAFSSPVSGKKHYFVLYSGKSSENDNKKLKEAEKNRFPNKVKIFTWDGTEAKDLHLNEGLYLFTISYDESTLYGVTANMDNEITLVKAKLK